MNTHAVWRGLVWKETRQIVPLVMMLLAVSAVLFLIWSFTSRQLNISLRAVGSIVPLIMPALYAAGAGAILVSHEKESGTWNWLASLPVPANSVVATKLAVGFGGLVLMWIGCVILSVVTGLERTISAGGGDGLAQFPVPVWIAHSVYVLVCGFFTAWKNRNAFPALLWILPLAILPFVVCEISLAWSGPGMGQYVDATQKMWRMGAITTIAIPIMGWFAVRAGQRALSPRDADILSDDRLQSGIDAWRPPPPSNMVKRPFSNDVAVLAWQSIHTSRWSSIGLVSMLAMGAIAWLVATNSRDGVNGLSGNVVGVLLGSGLLAISWLGVFAFTGDGAATRLKFLADRGVSPARVWLGRLGFGVSVLCSAALLIFAWQIFLGSPEDLGRMDGVVFPEMSLLTVVSVFALIYGVSQWTSQVVPMLAASAFLAPVLSVLGLFFLISAGMSYGVSLGWLIACVAIPFVSTLWTMGAFMDGRRGWMYWTITVVALFVFVALPVIPVAIDRLKFPSMSSERFAVLDAEARGHMRRSSLQSVAMRQSNFQLHDNDQLFFEDLDGKVAVDRLRQRDLYSPDSWVIIGDDRDVPLRADEYVLQNALQMATLLKLQWEQNPEDKNAKDQFRRFVERITHAAQGLRLSTRWVDQECADVLEIWLTQTLADESVAGLREEPFMRDAIEVVRDFEGRQDARRRALLVSWLRDRELSQGRPSGAMIAGVSANDYWFERVPIGWRSSILQQGMGAVVERCLALIEAGRKGEPVDAELRGLHRLLNSPGGEFEVGPYGERNRMAIGPECVFATFQNCSYPGTQWFAPWEETARAMSVHRESTSVATVPRQENSK